MPHSQPQALSSPIRGSIYKHKLPSAILAMERRLQIYLPPSYHEQVNRRYPVLYMHFGQHIFDPHRPGDDSWQVHRLIERLLAANRITELIVVGIATERATALSDYSHYVPYTEGGALGGLQYEQFILHELKPFIDSTYRTLNEPAQTAMIGACSGTVVTYNLAERNPTVFGKIGLLSPLVYSFDTKNWLYPTPLPKYNGLVWVGAGDAEGYHTPEARLFVDTLLARGFTSGKDLFYTLTPDAGHHDPYWGDQMIHPLLLFFGQGSADMSMSAACECHPGIGTPVAVELRGDDRVGISGQPLVVNPLVHYDSGFVMTALDGCYHVEPATVLRAEADGRFFGLCEGAAEVSFETANVSTTRRYIVSATVDDCVQFHLRAYVPNSTPDVERIYFSELPLERVGAYCYEGSYIRPRGFALADLFSCGMRQFEVQADGSPVPRRMVRANDDCFIEYTIERWLQ